MKDSKKYSQDIKKLLRSLKQSHPKVKKVSYEEPLNSVVYAIISENNTASQAKSILKAIESHFVSLNDLRVSRMEEMLEVFGAVNEQNRRTATALTGVLNAVFDEYDHVSLNGLLEEGKRQARKELEKLNGISPFAVNYCFLTALDGHAIPLTEKMLEYLKDNDLVHPEAAAEEVSGFLERQIGAADGYTFYRLLRQEVESGHKEPRKTVKTKTKKTTKRKTTAKSKAKK